MDDKTRVKKQIDAAAKSLGTRRAVAQRLGVSEPTMSEWYNGKKFPTLPHWFKLEALSMKWRARDDSNVRPLPSEGSALMLLIRAVTVIVRHFGPVQGPSARSALSPI